jgi:hypothetical protein
LTPVPFSNKIVEYDIPNNVEHMYIMELEDSTGPEVKYYYYFGIILYDGKERIVYNFQSDVPLFSDSANAYVDEGPEPKPYIPECATHTCSFYNFKDSPTKPGKKLFKVETLLDGEIKSQITPFV